MRHHRSYSSRASSLHESGGQGPRPSAEHATQTARQTHPQRMALPLAEPALRLIADKNSWRVAALVRNVPSMQLVTIVTSDLCTPLVVMHSCAASTTTPTPKGLSTLSRHEAISAVIFSCT